MNLLKTFYIYHYNTTIIGINISIVCWRDKELNLYKNNQKRFYQVELGFVEKYLY